MPPVTAELTTLSFDIDGTLLDFDAARRGAMRASLEELRRLWPSTPETLTIEAMIELREQAEADLAPQSLDPETLRQASFGRILEHVGRPDEALAAHLSALYIEQRFALIRPYPDVSLALPALRARYKVGLLSNGNSYPERSGLGSDYAFVVLAQAHSVEKPDPRIFQIAMRQAGCAQHEMLHVGDSLESDVAGAQRAGVRAVWLNRSGEQNDTGIRPDYACGSLTELLEMLP
jgi:FMN hydrolase / 5-amino-6-(5-phospho-D-ribitylamino)uracil phosphatase